MPRIRSIHPGFWTDEAVVSVSRDARLLFIGIWNQCDDKGVFEWKPVGLRLRIFPVDPIDAEPLLAELLAADLIRQFEVAGRPFGVVRNFAVYQRPKKPNSLYLLPPELRDFSGLGRRSSDKVGAEKKEGGGRRKSPPRSPPVGGRAGDGDSNGKDERNFWTSKQAEVIEEHQANVAATDAHSGGARVVHLPRRPNGG